MSKQQQTIGLSDHIPLSQSQFKGLYSRGNGEVVPDAYFSDCLNNKFSTGGVSSRDGLDSTPALTASNIVRFFLYKRLNETPRFIWLDNNGNLYDSLYYPVAIYQDVTFTDFSAVNYLNRLYITPHNRVHGISGKSVLVYEGSGTARLAGGVPPSGYTMTATESATSGNCEAGIHLVAICYETTSGFITAPGSSIAQVISTGGFKIALGSIPIGGAGIGNKVILATKSIPINQFTGNLFGYEFFFVPGETITNATTSVNLSFFDADLINSADYLFDNLQTIPAGVNLFVYSGRLGIVGAVGTEYTVYLSGKFDPETISEVDGFITVDASEGGTGLKNGFEHRKNLLLTSSDKIYSTIDSGDVPATWSTPVQIEKGAGCEPFAVATILDSRGLNSDRAFIADRSGLLCFEGYIKKPELSFNIESIWKRINKAYFNLVQVVDDPKTHRLVISVPLDSATAISHILYADYSEAFTIYNTLDEKLFKWSIWTFPSAVTSFVGDTDQTTLKPILHFAVAAGNIYTMKDNKINDYLTAIDSYWKTSLKDIEKGWIHHFGGVRFRASGSAAVQIYVFSEDDNVNQTPPALTITTSPGQDYDRTFNFNTERASLKFRVSSIDEYYTFNRVDIYAKPTWARRPA